jgi:hypothetical protein
LGGGIDDRLQVLVEPEWVAANEGAKGGKAVGEVERMGGEWGMIEEFGWGVVKAFIRVEREVVGGAEFVEGCKCVECVGCVTNHVEIIGDGYSGDFVWTNARDDGFVERLDREGEGE